jgi:hypothetical protein
MQSFYDEDDVRRLCGLAIFAQADSMQRAGHVLNAERASDTLSGDVRGVWRRVDRVTIQTRGNRLQPDCARHGAGFCQHAGALLLHWLRQPAAVSLVFADPVDAGMNALLNPASLGLWPDEDVLDDMLGVDPEFVDDEVAFGDTPEAEIAGLLEHLTIAVVREMARRRKIPVSGSRKAEVVEATAAGLADPANIAEALGQLSPSQLALLDAIQLASSSGEATDVSAFEIYRLLGGKGEPPLTSLTDLGLLFAFSPDFYRGRRLWIPRAVVAALPPREGLAALVRGRPIGREPEPVIRALLPLLMMVAQDIQAGGISARDAMTSLEYGAIPDGFEVAPADRDRLDDLLRTYNANERLRLIPTPLIPAADVSRLALQSGQPGGAVAFVAQLMAELEIAEQYPRLTVNDGMLRLLLEQTAFNQRQLLVAAWLRSPGWAEASLIFGDDGPIRLGWNPRHAAPYVSSAIAEGVSLVARLAGRVPPDEWRYTDSFVEMAVLLTASAAPILAQFRKSSQQLDFIWQGMPRPGQKLALNSQDGLRLFLRAIVDAVLGGPMFWLGLVDVRMDDRTVTAFRVRQAAGLLTYKSFELDDLPEPGTVSVSDDLTILVPVGSASISALGFILSACQLGQATAAGMHYQLTANGVQALFEHGLSAVDIVSQLSAQTGRPLPPAAQETLDRWWAGYGRVRLYDEVTLIELGDDLLLRELQAATSLGDMTLHQFSPRLIAVKEDSADLLLKELGARGYAPRIVEGG